MDRLNAMYTKQKASILESKDHSRYKSSTVVSFDEEDDDPLQRHVVNLPNPVSKIIYFLIH